MSFVEEYISGKVSLEDIHDFVDRWHAGEGDGKTLAEWLGLSWKDYARWVEDPSSLEKTLGARIKPHP